MSGDGVTPAAVQEKQEEFAKYSLAHLEAYVEARNAKSRALVVADHKSTISALGEDFQYSHMGKPEEFDSFLLSFLYKGPKDWDIMYCDKGQGGVSKANVAKPVLSFTNPKWVGPYHVYAWTGDGVAGSGLYMVSKSFLDRLPSILKESPFTEANGWLGSLCTQGKVTCFSYLQDVRAKVGRCKRDDDPSLTLA